MNPIEEYISIIHNRQQNPLPEGQYGEKHHIIPRACGGPNKKWNIVRLTAQEHFRCHCLLPLIYTTGEQHKRMVFAWRVTTNTHTTSEEEYARFREEHAKLMSESMKGKNTWSKGRPKPLEWRESMSGEGNPFHGKHHTEEAKQKNRKAHVGNTYRVGKHHSEETKRKIREAALRRWAKVKGNN